MFNPAAREIISRVDSYSTVDSYSNSFVEGKKKTAKIFDLFGCGKAS